ncbi:biopolymer transporter ExbD [Prosthecochloris sp. N3]|uniref:Biopolymer transporter ExbD n=1 Tax=Prosthecochloris ethylica TaxID=2743976 RepID=A0ABR9XQ63_9CHLB|nr:biopolymer transporter ExbD [Prosthecochloris ethylica]MBF0586461.1 biopolymer transporter ExbD [Prosthecochloris ethylica]MBF0636074.1 biopolymer transporter ExbD [Prosthecochloris ethylica]NUK47789.1 biopolymer transporter ExbD [Prosthecochloris ethylica]
MLTFDEPVKSRKWPDLAPMIDVIFLLLIFFMLTSLYAARTIPLDLPQAESSETPEKSTIDIVIEAGGGVTINNEPVEESMIEHRIRNLAETMNDPIVTIHADQAVGFGRFITIMDKTRKCGISRISVATEQVKTYEP